MSVEIGTRRVAGQYVRSQVRDYAMVELGIVVAAVAALLVGWLFLGVPSWILILLELGAIAALLGVRPAVERDIDRWRRGAEGEEAVGQILEELAIDGWHVLHDVTFGRGNIDHVAIGPGGVFAIETKSHRGQISLDRLDPKMLAQAYAEKKTLEEKLGVPARPLLVFSRAYVIGSVPAQRRGVTILPARMLPGFFSRQRPTLSPEEARSTHDRLAVMAGQAPSLSQTPL
ncbi:MAG: NERD domain-containing protein [Actinomycetota bacterium]|nr:NERD domain-containing protein [Actinomycetota bacterium]